MSKEKETTELQDDIVKIFRLEMAAQELSQSDLAERLGKSKTWVSERLNKKTGISLQAIELIAKKGLGIKLNVFPEKIESPED